MIKGILRIALISTVIFFTAQLGWSQSNGISNSGMNKGSYTEAGGTAPGIPSNTDSDCAVCKAAHAVQVGINAHTNPSNTSNGSSANPSGGTE